MSPIPADYVELPIWSGRGRSKRVTAWTLVDAKHADALKVHEWRMHQGYALCRSPRCAHTHRVFLHRLLLGLGADDGANYADHISRDKLDNRLSNLRVVSRKGNSQNLSPRAGGASRHRGVSWVSDRNCWLARVYVNGKTHNKYCATEAEAAEVVKGLRRKYMPYSEEAAA